MKKNSIILFKQITLLNRQLLLCFSLLFFTLIVGAQTQRIKITGTIRDSSGLVLPGAGVKVKGDALASTISDVKGRYSISVLNTKAKLVFSFVGAIAKEEIVGGRTEINVVLVPGSSSLDEVVVIGYGTQKKRDVTGAISSVSSKQIAERQAVDVLDALQGQTPGVQIAQESGRPGAGSSIRIRGTATLEGGADPLYIVDGAQGVNIDGINPSDIESIEVLRDAASAAIYGSRSANGVIIITTKRGKDGKVKIDFRETTSFGKLAHKVPQANAAERRLFDVKRASFAGTTSTVPTDSLNPGLNNDNDYQNLLTTTGIKHQVDLSVSGGTKQLNYFGSFGLLKDNGIIVNSFSNIARGRFNIDYKPNDKVSFGTRIQLSYRTDNRISDGTVLVSAIERPATFRVYLPDGTLAPPLAGSANPLADALLRRNNFDIYDGSLYNFISYNFNADLKLTVDANVSANTNHNLTFSPYLLSTATVPVDNLGDSLNLTTYWQVQAYFNYAKTIARKHSITAVLGTSADQNFKHSSYQSGSNLVGNETILTMNAAQDRFPAVTYEERNFSNSYFARLGYSHMGRYILNTTFRADASSRFGRDNRWGNYTSASFAWRFSDENFMEKTKKFLDDGKLRISYGLTGNDRIGSYQAINQYTLGNDYYNGVSGIAPYRTLGNPRLSWESTTQTNIGLDLAMLKGRLNISVDLYNKTTRNLLYSAPLSENTGYKSVEVNVGAIRNQGIEFMVSGIPYRNNGLTWNISYNMSINNNKVSQLYNGTDLLPDNPNIWKVSQGGHLGDFYGYKTLGIYTYDQSNAYTSDWTQLTPVFGNNGTFTGYTLNGKAYSGTVQQLTTNGLPFTGGDMIWQNTSKDSVIDDNDRVVLGNAIPKWVGDITNSFTYKGFSLSFNLYISWGSSIYNGVRADMNSLLTTNITPEPDFIYGSWLHPGDVTIYPKAKLNSGLGNSRAGSSLYIEDASFIRLRNIRFTYQIPRSITSKIKLNTISVFSYVNNLFVWTKYKGYDPEISMSSTLTPGNDMGRYPRKREIGLGINVNF